LYLSFSHIWFWERFGAVLFATGITIAPALSLTVTLTFLQRVYYHLTLYKTVYIFRKSWKQTQASIVTHEVDWSASDLLFSFSVDQFILSY
jgi:ferredoxin-NADP reductase